MFQSIALRFIFNDVNSGIYPFSLDKGVCKKVLPDLRFYKIRKCNHMNVSPLMPAS